MLLGGDRPVRSRVLSKNKTEQPWTALEFRPLNSELHASNMRWNKSPTHSLNKTIN